MDMGEPTRGGPFSLRLGGSLTTLRSKKTACYEILHRASDLEGFSGLF
jgi:hypothetical protein